MDEHGYTSLSVQHSRFALSLLTCDGVQLAISHVHIFLLPQTSIRRRRRESDSHWHAQVNNPRALEERASRGNGRSTREMHFVDFANKRAGILFKIVDCLNHPDLCAPRCPRPATPATASSTNLLRLPVCPNYKALSAGLSAMRRGLRGAARRMAV